MNIYIVIDTLFVVAFAILFALSDNVNWTHVFMGFAMGMSLHEVLTFFRDRERFRNQRKLR